MVSSAPFEPLLCLTCSFLQVFSLLEASLRLNPPNSWDLQQPGLCWCSGGCVTAAVFMSCSFWKLLQIIGVKLVHSPCLQLFNAHEHPWIPNCHLGLSSADSTPQISSPTVDYILLPCSASQAGWLQLLVGDLREELAGEASSAAAGWELA